ncbi:hypothetical protein JAAARDRAFT_204333 [Jaapia argillacea MUCL 33604]|uniref:Uncharacterized protein n=1 Tax=Jaapia argillacea MUCL 33604 TaxID=933084 RepID=A0A067QEP1_9AGAM|nr:hypothetical protein JAAARDRAFT_204333 [Jaapia argillacea MUCL 33604]
MPLDIDNTPVVDDVPIDALVTCQQEGEGSKKTKHNPMLDAFVTLSIDPVATVQDLEDPVALAEAEKLHCKTYIGLIDIYHGLPGPHDPFTQTSISLVGQGLPPHSEEYFSQPSMSIPLSPGAEHPLGRDPLKLTNLLPWPNCYIYTWAEVTARIRSAPYDDSLIVSKISDNSDGWRKAYFLITDRDAQGDLENTSGSTAHVEKVSKHATQDSPDAGLDWQAVYTQLATSHIDQDAEIQSCAVSRGDSTTWLGSSSDVDASAHEHTIGVMAAMLSLNSTPSVMTVVDAWYDLSKVSAIPDPQGFFEETKALDEIKRASKKPLDAPEPPPLPIVDEVDRRDVSQSSLNEIVEQNSGSTGSDEAVVAHSPVPLPDCEEVRQRSGSPPLDNAVEEEWGLKSSADPEEASPEDQSPRSQGMKRSITDVDGADEHRRKKTRLDVVVDQSLKSQPTGNLTD